MITLLKLYVSVGSLLVALSIPLIMRKIKPNPLYGFRVQQTLEDPPTWFDANVYSGWRLLWAGIGAILSAVVLYFIPVITLEGYALGCLGVILALLTVGLIQSLFYLRKLAGHGASKEQK